VRNSTYQDRTFNDILITENLISPQKLAQVLGERENTTEPIGDMLVRLGLITERDKARCLGKQNGIAYADLAHRELDPRIARLIPHPLALKHLNALFTLIALVLFFASHAPPNHFRAWLHHPMAAGVAVWTAGHLMATGLVRDVVLFGAFLVWAIADFIAGRRRDRVENTQYAAGTAKGDIGAVVIGVIVWALFAFWLHELLIGVKPPV